MAADRARRSSALPCRQPRATIPVPRRAESGKKVDAAAFRDILTDDARHLAAFVERWRPRSQRSRTRGTARCSTCSARRVARAPAAVRAGGRGLEDVLGRRTDRRRARRRRAADALAGVDDHREVAIALGSNLGDREALSARRARSRCAHSSSLCASRRCTTPRRSASAASRIFLNAAAVGETSLSARARCSTRCSPSSSDSGRERPFPGAPRTLDLDLILYGDDVIDEAGPHRAASAIPRAALRARAAGRDCAGLARSGDRANGRASC